MPLPFLFHTPHALLLRTEGSSKEEQIIQKEQILAELQRVEKELQEKAQAQQQVPGKREAGDGLESGGEPGGAGCVQPLPPFTFQVVAIISDLDAFSCFEM